MSQQASPPDEESGPANHEDRNQTGSETSNNPGFPRVLYDRLVKAAEDELVYKSNGNTILNLATLQRMQLFHLQLKIVKEAGHLANRDFSNGNPLDALKTLMADYGNSDQR
jgi:hypothetical protein